MLSQRPAVDEGLMQSEPTGNETSLVSNGALWLQATHLHSANPTKTQKRLLPLGKMKLIEFKHTFLKGLPYVSGVSRS